MKNKKLFLTAAFCFVATFLVAQAIVRSGWTTTGDPDLARAALGVGDTTVTNLVVTETNFVNVSIVTNLYVIETNYVNVEYVTNLYVTEVRGGRITIETNINTYIFTTNLYATTINATTNINNYTITTNSSRFERKTLAYSGTNVWVDWNTGTSFDLTLTGDTHLIMTNVPTDLDQVVNILLLNDGTGGYGVSFDYHMMWPGGTAPTISTDPDTWDVISMMPGPFGTNEVACVIQQDFR
jgi:hypothetical protein